MSFALVRTLIMVTVGAVLLGHAAVQWGRRKADAGALAPNLAVGFGTVSAGLALLGTGPAAAVVELGALGLIAGALVAMVRRGSRNVG